MKKLWKKLSLYARDVIERITRTFIGAFVMTYLAGLGPDVGVLGALSNADLADKAALSGVMAVGSLIVAIATKGLGPGDIASIQKHLDPEPAPVVVVEEQPAAAQPPAPAPDEPLVTFDQLFPI